MAELKKLTASEYKNIYDTMYSVLCLFANTYVNNLDLAKDIVQDVFIKIWEDNIEFHNQFTVKSYLYTSVRNRSLDYLKSHRVKVTESLVVDDFIDAESDPFFLQEVVIAETTNIIDNAINTLPKKCAQIIRLSVKGKSNAEIAEELGLSLNTIKAQKKIAYKRLKPLLEHSFVLIAFVFDI
ncbi:RNA polymerase sigma-70 factor [Flavobacterium sp. MAHUQ-51]|uniref:RNA polymerase sigma-70 factor n=1 Tax=Flavobacterium sp. GCM10022190 TaxID=3252639 RepID=UPI003610B4A0